MHPMRDGLFHSLSTEFLRGYGLGERVIIPRVALSPTFIRPKRRNGVDSVVRFGESLRIIITSDGFAGMSLDVMVGRVRANTDDEAGIWRREMQREGMFAGHFVHIYSTTWKPLVFANNILQ